MTTKRGGAKSSGLHLGLLILCTLLLTVSGVFLIMHMNVAGILTLLLALVVRFLDSRL